MTNGPTTTPGSLPINLMLLGSVSDEPKVARYKELLETQGILIYDMALSAHRTPDEVKVIAKLSEEGQLIVYGVKTAVEVATCAAGGANHLAGAFASCAPSIPTIAIPVGSNTFGDIFGDNNNTLNSKISTHDMPPEIPVGLAMNNSIAAKMTEKIMKLNLPEGYNKVAVPDDANIDFKILESLGIEIDQESPIQIVIQNIDNQRFNSELDSSRVSIIIPTAKPLDTRDWNIRDIGAAFIRLKAEGLYMGWQSINKINYTNALIFAAQILARKGNYNIKHNLRIRRNEAKEQVLKANEQRESRNNYRLQQIAKLIKSGLGFDTNNIDFSSGNEQLEGLGYVHFYTGFDKELYIIPNDSELIQILRLRTDKNTESHEKGELLPKDIPEELRDRCKVVYPS